MSTWRVNSKKGAAIISATLLSVISVGLVQADSPRPLSQYLIVQAAIDGVLAASGGFPDCNENGVDDAQDIADLTSPDCNGNGIPDECELAGNDCNSDARPDECGVFISCDIDETQKLTASNPEAFDLFGSFVSISGDTAIIGALGDDCPVGPGTGCGAAYVFRFNGSNWIEEQRITASDGSAGNAFGQIVSVTGNTAFVTAFGAGSPGSSASGAVYVYRPEGSNWMEKQKLVASDAVSFDLFGAALSIDGETAVIGAPFKDCGPGTDCGAAYVFRFDGTNWIEDQKLTASDMSAADYFGVSASISGDTVVVGANGDDCAPDSNCGAAYIFHFDGTSWVEKQKLTAAAVGDRFAEAVSIDGGTIVAGATGDDCAAGINCGAVYVYRFDGTNWTEEQKLTASDASPRNEFGTSVSISGDTVLVGTFSRVYVYRYDGSIWIEVQKLTVSDAAPLDFFGHTLSIRGDWAIVGAERVDSADSSSCGAAYFFDLIADDCNCNGFADLCESQPDCDGDGLFDSCEVDSDGDGIPDDCDICPTGDDTIDTDGDSVPDACDVCPGGDDLLDTDGDTVPDDCDICDNNLPETCTFASPILAPLPHNILKNRYISVDPLGAGDINVGLTFDIRVELVSTLVNGVDPAQVGSQWWANVPDANCISKVGPTRPTVPRNWDACPTLHLTGCPIIPTATYDIVAVVGGLASFPPLAAETQALPVDNKWWGDAVGFFNGSVWSGPQGVSGFDDVTAALKTFQNPTGINATHVSVTDLHPNRPDLGGISVHPNLQVNIDDVFQFIGAFQGREYPGGDLAGCTDP